MTRRPVSKRRWRWALAAWPALLALLALGAFACGETSDIAYTNLTDRTLEVSIDGEVAHTLAPQETLETSIDRFSGTRLFEVTFENGEVIFSEFLTWDNLRAREFMLLFTDVGPPPINEGTRGPPKPGPA